MKMKLKDVKINSFITKIQDVKGGGYTQWGCYTNNCPSEWDACGPTGLC